MHNALHNPASVGGEVLNRYTSLFKWRRSCQLLDVPIIFLLRVYYLANTFFKIIYNLWRVLVSISSILQELIRNFLIPANLSTFTTVTTSVPRLTLNPHLVNGLFIFIYYFFELAHNLFSKWKNRSKTLPPRQGLVFNPNFFFIAYIFLFF